MRFSLFNRKILSIDFGSSEIKIIEGQAVKKNIKISREIAVKIPRDSYKDGEVLEKKLIVDLLKQALSENKVSTEITYGIINSSLIITREINIPLVDEKEIEGILEYQIEDVFPVSPEDYVIKHLVMGEVMEDDMERLNLLIIGIPKTIVLDHLEIIKKIGLKPKILDFQGNAMAKLFKVARIINEDYMTRDVVFAVVDMGYDNTKLTITQNGKIEVTRVINIGSRTLYNNISSFFDYTYDEIEDVVLDIKDINVNEADFTDYNRVINIIKSLVESLLEEMEMIFRYYRTRDMNNDINIIILQGGLSNIKGIDNLYSNFFNIPAVVLDSLDEVQLEGKLSKFSNAIGGLIRMDEV